MAGLSIGGPTSSYGTLATRGPVPGGVPTGVSNASRGGPSQPSWTMPATMTPQQSLMYGQADITRGMQGGQQAYERALAEQKRGWALEDQGTMMGLWDKTSGAGGEGTPRVGGGDESWGTSMAAAMGQAKDNAAAGVGAARRALINNMTQRGIGGSGIEGKNERAIQIAGAGQIGAAGRDIATQTAARTAAVNDRNYSGNIQQRGQDMQASQAKLSMIPSLLGLFRASSY